MPLRWNFGSNRLCQWRCKFGHRFGLQVAVLELPLVFGFEQHGANQADKGPFVREDADGVDRAA